MRGYPGGIGNHYMALQHLIPTAFKSPLFRKPTWQGPDLLDTTKEQHTFEPIATPSFHGPIALLVGPQAISAAENFSMMLVGTNRVRVVGRRTAGTNGNITRLRLQGGFWFYYTGMEVLYPDGSTRLQWFEDRALLLSLSEVVAACGWQWPLRRQRQPFARQRASADASRRGGHSHPQALKCRDMDVGARALDASMTRQRRFTSAG